MTHAATVTNRPRRITCVLLPLLAIATFLSASPSRADDWPTYQHDHARSAVTSESPRLPLRQSWTVRSRFRPQAAWDEPATWDGWNKVFNLKNRQVFDKAFHVAAVGGAVYFGSSVDDKLYCLDAATGETRWAFYTEGPIRLAPIVLGDKVYFGSDDGQVYCLAAADGKLLWKHRPGPEDRRVPGNGRMISVWPIRSGLVVVDGVVYYSAGVFPHETVYVGALDAETGEPVWKTALRDFPAQGYLLASATRLYVTTGRGRPLVFDRASGERLYQLSGGVGGTYALLSGDMLLYGPSKTGQISAFGAESKDQIASFTGNHLIVRGRMSYLHTDRELSAVDRPRYLELLAERDELTKRRNAVARDLKAADGDEAQRLRNELEELRERMLESNEALQATVAWNVPCEYPLSLILAGDKLVAGGAGRVAMFDVDTGREAWQAEVEGNAFGLALAGGRLYVSTDEGTIHCFTSEPQTAAR